MTVWECSCGMPWATAKHRAHMARDGSNSHWRGSPGLLVPYRQWIREQLPNGNQGFACCGDDGLFRSFDPKDRKDVGHVVPVEWKTFGRKLDEATRKALGGVVLGRAHGALCITLHGGNVPGPLAHYPIAREIADDDWLPEQPKVAERITVNDFYALQDEEVTEARLIVTILAAVRPQEQEQEEGWTG